MLHLKDIINQNNSLRFLYESVEIQSSLGRQRLLETPFITDSQTIEEEFLLLDQCFQIANNTECKGLVEKLKHELYQMHNISLTIKRLSENSCLDDIELYEIKRICINLKNIAKFLKDLDLNLFSFHNLQEAINILDPDKTEIAHFYIYSSYNQELTRLRNILSVTKDLDLKSQIQLQCTEIEDEIRKKLSAQLVPFAQWIQDDMEKAAKVDILLAKADLAIRWNCCRPEIAETRSEFTELFHPIVKQQLEKSRKEFQSIDIQLNSETVLITGANMSGKTVFLKTLAFAQYMFQLGFFVPAKCAKMVLVNEIICSIGDQQSEMNGLSSFCVEILTINHIIKEVKKGEKVLVLVDELARTTNPCEGKALVSAFINIMNRYQTPCVITTHYDIGESHCRRLRVKGLEIKKIHEKITPYNINNYMDYSLIETSESAVPTEAVNIAKIFKVDEEFLQLAASICATSDNPL